jgi:hypothetical protein
MRHPSGEHRQGKPLCRRLARSRWILLALVPSSQAGPRDTADRYRQLIEKMFALADIRIDGTLPFDDGRASANEDGQIRLSF